MVKQLQQWFSLHDMGEEGQITVEAAQMPGTMVDVYAVGWPTNMTIIVPSGKLT